MPQISAIVTVDIVSLPAENGSCTSQRRPPVSVTVGESRHESCAKAEYMSIRPSRRRGPNATYLLVSGSSAAWPVTDVTRPVSSPYSSRASVSWPADALGKLAVVKRPFAGSFVALNPSWMPGTICCAFSHAVARRNDPPTLTLCRPLSQVSDSSTL